MHLPLTYYVLKTWFDGFIIIVVNSDNERLSHENSKINSGEHNHDGPNIS